MTDFEANGTSIGASNGHVHSCLSVASASACAAPGPDVPHGFFIFPKVPECSFEELMEVLDPHGLLGDEDVNEALALVRRLFGEKRRKDSSPVLEGHLYPVTVLAVKILTEVGREVSSRQVIVCLLHDILDYSDHPESELREYFGDEVGDDVKVTSKLPLENFPGHTEAEQRTARTAHQVNLLSEASFEAQLAKLCDRYMNWCSRHVHPEREALPAYRLKTDPYIPLFGQIHRPLADALVAMMEQVEAYSPLAREAPALDITDLGPGAASFAD